jgi:secreted trypsin-like serine protease
MPRRGKTAVVIAIALLTAVIAPTGAAGEPGERSTSVINGDEAVAGAFPYLALVSYRDSIDSRLCTGSVVASNVVLTAAHCVLRDGFEAAVDPAFFRVVTGNVHYLAEPRTISTVTSFAVAPNFRAEPPLPTPLAGDVAVLILARPVSSPPVRLATSKVWSAGTPVVFAGWGETGTPDAGDVLRSGKSSVQSDSYCVARFSRHDPSQQICTQDTLEHRYAACHGDSGGPLLMTAPGTVDEPLQIGIDSFGTAVCSPEAPSFFARADVVASWVAAIIAANPPASPTAPPAPPAPTSSPAPTSTGSTHRKALPRITAGAARTKATAALRRRLGARFADRRDYEIACDEINVHKQECRVHWQTADSRYRGTVTVFGVFVAGKTVWRTPYAVTAVSCGEEKAARARPACQTRTFRGG